MMRSKKSKTPEERSATFRVQGLGFLLIFFDFLFFVDFFFKKSFFHFFIFSLFRTLGATSAAQTSGEKASSSHENNTQPRRHQWIVSLRYLYCVRKGLDRLPSSEAAQDVLQIPVSGRAAGAAGGREEQK